MFKKSQPIEKLRKKALKVCLKLIEETTSFHLNKAIMENIQITKFRIKSVKSIETKMKIKNKQINDIHDLMGITFVMETVEECYTVLSNIQKMHGIKIIQIKDYVAAPKGVDKYQAIHIHIKYKGILGEIKLMDFNMKRIDEETHDTYKKRTCGDYFYPKQEEFQLNHSEETEVRISARI